jgi:GTP diphosphokinase / guanosine-3',5'-bis(diphosphate) 3'-diphosphatase
MILYMAHVKDLLTKIHNGLSNDEEELVRKAYAFACDAHEGQKRYSGEPYFNHAFETAKILAEIGMSATVISAGLLHDVIEDTDATVETLGKEFGEEIVFLVDGVTKLGTLRFQGLTRHSESLRKLFVSSSKDIRVIIIKLADRLHNMRTLEYVPEHKRKRIAQETLEIYAPLSYRLGIRKITKELEDLAFPYVYPREAEKTKRLLHEREKEVEIQLEKVYKLLKKKLAEHGLRNAKTEFRTKGVYSLYKKLVRKDMNLEGVHDLAALRVIVPTVEDCYKVLGIIHGTWRPLPGRVKDYIAFEKPNGYQSIHTDIFTGGGSTVEVQIRTEEMHREAEFGVANHFTYKNGGAKRDANSNLLWLRQLLPRSFSREKETSKNWESDVPEWVRNLNDYQEEEFGVEFLDNLKNDFVKHRIFVFTPKGEVVDLPIDSTPVDFAYTIHSDIGSKISGAKINGKMSSLSTTLKNGDRVEIITSKNAKPNRKWLDFAKTAVAKKHIRASIEAEHKT